ncbi:hypothetical protein AOLI_G00307300 [Acnodon oligacanthus]
MAEQIGEQVLSRTLTVYLQTKTYFSHWKDLTAASSMPSYCVWTLQISRQISVTPWSHWPTNKQTSKSSSPS